MHRRLGSAFAIAAAFVFPLTANAQVAQTGQWAGNGRPYWQTYARPSYAQPPYPRPTYAQPAYPQSTHAQPTYPYPQAYMRPAAAPAYYSSTPMPMHAAYAYSGYPSYGAQYPATPSYYGYSTPGRSWGPRPEAPEPLVKTQDNLHYIEMGVGAFIPTDQGNPAKLGLEASLWALHGGWVQNSGLYLTLDASTGFDMGCLAKRATDGCKVHLRVHWIGAGPFFNTGTPMIASDVPRAWDLMALTGAELRLYKGLTVKTTVNWFVPSPWGIYAYEKQRAEASLTTADTEVANPADRVQSIFGHALGHPQINLMALWEF
jgi:hypothetical protein